MPSYSAKICLISCQPLRQKEISLVSMQNAFNLLCIMTEVSEKHCYGFRDLDPNYFSTIRIFACREHCHCTIRGFQNVCLGFSY